MKIDIQSDLTCKIVILKFSSSNFVPLNRRIVSNNNEI